MVYRDKRDANFNLQQSILELNYPFAEVDSLGNLLTGYAITIHGDWTKSRVADFLPLDYRPGQ